jgi:hypothetical protein
MLVALGDLAFRFPNALEPWTEHLYGSRTTGSCLHDPDPSVRHDALMVLTHLILNDMMKVKGHVSEMMMRLEDPEPRIANLVRGSQPTPDAFACWGIALALSLRLVPFTPRRSKRRAGLLLRAYNTDRPPHV